jgi:hypothetical protein
MAYANVTTLQMIQHLYHVYGCIISHDIQENMSHFTAPWAPNLAFKTSVEQIEYTVDFASSGGVPITTQMQVNTAYTLLFNTGVFTEARREWLHHHLIKHTWNNICIHFAQAHEDNCLVQQHIREGGRYQKANNALESFVNDTAEAFANLATAAAAHRDVVLCLTNTNTELLQ